MHKNRIEAFSDGFIAIIITIMVLDLNVPNGVHLADLLPLGPHFLCYFLSFLYLAVYWNNHHHLFQSIQHVNGKILWANTFLLLCISLIPFVTAWAGERQFASVPTACYGFILFMAAIAYRILTVTLISSEGKNSLLAKAIGRDLKGRISILIYAIAIVVALWFPMDAVCIYLLVALMWFVPDKRIERRMK